MRNEQPVRRRKTDTERQRNTVPDKKVRRNSGNRSAPAKEQKQEPQKEELDASSSVASKAARIRRMKKKSSYAFLLVLLIAAYLLAGAGAAVFMSKDIFPGTGTKVQRFRRILRFPDSRFRGKGGWFCGRSVCGFRRHSSGYCSSGRRSGRTSPGYQKQTGIVFQRSL